VHRIARLLVVPLAVAALLFLPGSSPPRMYPRVIAGLGDSITRAANACCQPGDRPGQSWSTGYQQGDGIRSHYERFAALDQRIAGHNYNNSVSGAKAEDLPAQVAAAISQEADYITILIGSNDLCTSSVSTMTSPIRFAGQINAALEMLHERLPRARIFVSSIPDIYRLWSVLHTDREARQAWTASRICQSMLAAANTEAQRQEVVSREVAFNRILADACSKYRNCRWDRGAVYNYKFPASQISTVDYFHPGPSGQAALADVTWNIAGQQSLP
jgi:lysophospholipase L1-like esterase